MIYIYILIFFIFGTAVGSFVGVIADRYNTGLSFLRGRSFCFFCNNTLSKRDLFPIFSFLFLKGKCRFCRKKIPTSSFITEILMGFLSVLVAFKSGIFVFLLSGNQSLIIFNFSLLTFTNYLILLSIFAIILLISLYDLKHFIIPDSFLISFFVLSFIYLLFFPSPFLLSTFYFLLQNFASAIFLALPFLLIFLFSSGRWIGFGDVKYIFVIGFLLGFIQGLSGVILAFWIGSLFSFFALLLNKMKSQNSLPSAFNNLTIKSEIPFGPFLSIGAVSSLLLSLDLFSINEILQLFQ